MFIQLSVSAQLLKSLCNKFYIIIINISLLLFLIILSNPAISKNSDEDETFKKARIYFFNKKFEMAKIYLEEVIRKDPENVLAYSYLGDIYLTKKQFDRAMNHYRKALDLKPNIAENLFRIGQIYYYQKNGPMAIQYFLKSYDQNDKLKFAYYHIGLTYLMLERDKNYTIQYWEKYLSIAPEDYQYENIKRAIELLKDPNFKIPSKDSDISIEEALFLGGVSLENVTRKSEDKKAGHEKKKTNKKVEEIYLDDDL